jgi:hypothetical protein
VSRRPRRRPEPLPAPLPPETRTVGQLIAETIRFYGRRFWPSLALGVPPAAAGLALAEIPSAGKLPFALVVGAACVSISYARAAALVAEESPARPTLLRAVGTGVFVLAPVVLLVGLVGFLAALPAVAWLGLVGLVVPVIVIERRGAADAYRRALALGRADYVHAAGSLAALTIVSFVTAWVMFFLLRSAGEAALRVAAFASVLVISPVLFLGSALLYFDQAARIGSAPRPTRRRDADVHPALEADRSGRADAEVESRPAARGQS